MTDSETGEGKAASTGGVMAIRLALSIVEALAKQETVGVTELARALGTTKPRVFRHLRTLVDLGYAAQDPGTERYCAGPRMAALLRAAALTPDESLIRIARPVMARLRDRFGHAVNLSLVFGDSATIVETLQGNSFVGVTMRTHMPMPLHTTAAGKLLLAEMLEKGRDLPEVFERFTEHSITDPASLRGELARVAGQGWAAAPEETVLGVNAISAPIRDHRGELAAMISIVGSIQYIARQPAPELIEAVQTAAAEISRALAV